MCGAMSHLLKNKENTAGWPYTNGTPPPITWVTIRETLLSFFLLLPYCFLVTQKKSKIKRTERTKNLLLFTDSAAASTGGRERTAIYELDGVNTEAAGFRR
jgi:hypothetical protein